MEGKGGTEGSRVGVGRERKEDERGKREERGRGAGSHHGPEPHGQEKSQVARNLIARGRSYK